MAAMLALNHSEVVCQVGQAACFAEDVFTCQLPLEAYREL